jgi:hypothetical protein
MNWRLTPEERRIIAHTQRESEQAHPSPEGLTPGSTETPPTAEVPLWRSVMIWIGGIVFLVGLAMFLLWLGSLFG